MTDIFTGSWRADIDPEVYGLISISRSAPRGRRGYRVYSALMPGIWFRDTANVEAWTTRYETEVLAKLDATKVVEEICTLAGGKPAVLLCWEPPPPNTDWCHRGHVSKWLNEQLGLEVWELNHENSGYGPHHPKMPRLIRE